jgi:hypothetical protein
VHKKDCQIAQSCSEILTKASCMTSRISVCNFAIQEIAHQAIRLDYEWGQSK